MDKIKKIITIFSSTTSLLTFVAYSLGMLIVSGIATALIPNPIFVRMILTSTLDYFFLISTSLLAGIYFALPLNYCNADRKAMGGSILGFLAFACPTCNKIFVLLLGFVFVNTIIDPLRPLFGVLSIVVLLYAINKKIN